MFKFKKDLNQALSKVLNNHNFNELIFMSMIKADKDNLIALSRSFPEHYKTFDAYKKFGIELDEEL